MRHWKDKLVYACDPDWWDVNVSAVMDADLDAELWTQDKKAAEKYHLNWIESKPLPNLSARDSGVIHQGQNSGFQAINLARLQGATHVFLLGYDMTRAGGSHWFGDHPAGLQRNSSFKAFKTAYETIDVPDMTIINCSRNTALTNFPRMTIQDAINDYC